jgi:hypothetical protein
MTIPSPGTSRGVWLRFAGLDTIVDVYLNGERIASHLVSLKTICRQTLAATGRILFNIATHLR